MMIKKINIVLAISCLVYSTCVFAQDFPPPGSGLELATSAAAIDPVMGYITFSGWTNSDIINESAFYFYSDTDCSTPPNVSYGTFSDFTPQNIRYAFDGKDIYSIAINAGISNPNSVNSILVLYYNSNGGGITSNGGTLGEECYCYQVTTSGESYTGSNSQTVAYSNPHCTPPISPGN